MLHIKNVKVRNPKVVQVMIPGFIATEKLKLKTGDVLEVYLSNDGQELTIRKREVQAGSNTDEEGQGLFRNAT